MGTYTKSSVNRAARPRSERLRQMGGTIVSTSASVMGSIPVMDSHSHANLADLNMITVSDGYIYLTDTVTDEISGEQVVVTDKVKAGYAEKNIDGHTLDWFIPVTVDGDLTLKLNPIYTGLWMEGWMGVGGVGGSGSTSAFELTANKVTSLSSLSTDVQYPSAKCVYDIIGDVETLLAAL